jgi:hypothetical protein
VGLFDIFAGMHKLACAKSKSNQHQQADSLPPKLNSQNIRAGIHPLQAKMRVELKLHPYIGYLPSRMISLKNFTGGDP